MNYIALYLWTKYPTVQTEEFLVRMRQIVIGILICAALAGMFASYRFGEYMQTKRLAQTHSQIIQVPVYTN